MYVKSARQAARRQSAAVMAAVGGYASGGIPCGQQAGLQRLSVQMLEIQESERRRIATDLHDVLGQSLTVIKLLLDESVMLLAANETDRAVESLQRVKLKVKDAFDDLRRVAMDLRPAIIDDLGVLATLSWFFREFELACRDITVEKFFNIQESSIPTPLRIIIFRIVQEATNNIVKHANASRIWISLKKTGAVIHLSISDNGNGFDPEAAGKSRPFGKGYGLLSMKERAELSGGSYMLESTVGQGTRIDVSWRVGEQEIVRFSQKTPWLAIS